MSTKLHEHIRRARFDMHYAFELGVVLSGSMDRLYEGHYRNLGPGQVWLCSAWEPHGWRVTETPCRAVVVSIFPPALANNRFPELLRNDWLGPFIAPASKRANLPVAQRQLVQELGHRLSQSGSEPLPQRLLLQRMLTYQILLELPCTTEGDHAASRAERSWGSVDRAVSLIFQKRRFVTVAEAAHECGVGPKALKEFFVQTTGLSFAKFALRCRLQGAASQLLESSDPVKAVGQDWGFTDTSYFQASFQAGYGSSPARYRANWEKGGPQ